MDSKTGPMLAMKELKIGNSKLYTNLIDFLPHKTI